MRYSRSDISGVIAVIVLVLVPSASPAFEPAREDLVEVNRCGPRALQVCAAALGRPITSRAMEVLFPQTGDESSFLELKNAAEALGLAALAVQWDGDLPKFEDGPAIVAIANGQQRLHFVAVLQSDARRLLILDFPHRPFWLPIQALRSRLNWDGQALYVAEDKVTISTLESQIRRWPRYVPTAVIAAGFGLLGIGLFTKLRPALGAVASRPRRRVVASGSRSGFTIVELLVSLAIIGVLLSLILPAVQGSRESRPPIAVQEQFTPVDAGLHGPSIGCRALPRVADRLGINRATARSFAAFFHAPVSGPGRAL